MCSCGSSSVSARTACPAASLAASSCRAKRCAVVMSMSHFLSCSPGHAPTQKARATGEERFLRCTIHQKVAPTRRPHPVHDASETRSSPWKEPHILVWCPSRMSVGSCLGFAVLSLNGPRFTTGCSIARGCSRLAVDLLADALHRAVQVICRAAHTSEIAARKRITHSPDVLLHLAARARRDSVTGIPQRPLRLIGQAVGVVARLNLLAALAVLLRMYLGFAHHVLDFLLGEAAGGGNCDLLLAPACLIACRNIENAVGIDIEGHFNLWHASGGRRNALQAEAPQALVVARQFALALQHVDLHRRLVIFCRTEGLAFACRNGRVALDH